MIDFVAVKLTIVKFTAVKFMTDSKVSNNFKNII